MAITRLSGGLTPADGADPRTFPTIWNESADFIEQGFRFVGTRYFVSSGTFEKADPFDDGNPDGLVVRAIRVRMVGGGGGGGGTQACAAGESAAGSGGGGGGYAEAFITDIAGLSSSETVVRGAGGSGGSGLADGQNGGTSTFGPLTATGGSGGLAGSASSVRTARFGARGGEGSGGDLNFEGNAGSHSYILEPGAASGAVGGKGGGSAFGGARENRVRIGAGVTPGLSAVSFGAGGGGPSSREGAAGDGGDGADGIVVIDCFV